MKYRILALTDHRDHSKENSLYDLLKEIRNHERCEQLMVASRGNVINDKFFYKFLDQELQVIEIEDDFSFDPTGRIFLDDTIKVELGSFDIVLLRLPRPIEDDFLNFLNLFSSKLIFINHPNGILKTSSKSFLLNHKDLCPPIKLCNSIDDVLNFSKEYDIVLKPLKEYGGKGILKITNQQVDDGQGLYPLHSYLKEIEAQLVNEGYLGMKFLKNVKNGDKRLIVVDGEILAASLRLPKAGSWLCNVAQGGYSVLSEADEKEHTMIHKINPGFRRLGVLIYGVDTLEDDNGERVLSEINTMSIGGFPQAQKQTGKPIISYTVNKIFKYADESING